MPGNPGEPGEGSGPPQVLRCPMCGSTNVASNKAFEPHTLTPERLYCGHCNWQGILPSGWPGSPDWMT